eukprot:6202703-Pleurochrysis_carterae.AAC.1
MWSTPGALSAALALSGDIKRQSKPLIAVGRRTKHYPNAQSRCQSLSSCDLHEMQRSSAGTGQRS